MLTKREDPDGNPLQGFHEDRQSSVEDHERPSFLPGRRRNLFPSVCGENSYGIHTPIPPVRRRPQMLQLELLDYLLYATTRGIQHMEPRDIAVLWRNKHVSGTNRANPHPSCDDICDKTS